jgi:phosphohistidine phosphatase
MGACGEPAVASVARLGHDKGMSGRAEARGRYLWILRHGKAASDAPLGGGDRERPLTARGRRDATALGKDLATGEGPFGTDEIVLPEMVMCSAAVRTRQTADLVIEASGTPLPLESRRSLYEADVETALDEVQDLDAGVTSALIVGHNPTMYRLALELLAEEDGDETAARASRRGREALFAREFPTCALAALFLPVDGWDEVRAGIAELRGFFTPPY